MKVNANNEKLKREYKEWLKATQRKSPKTMDVMMSSIYLYDDFTNHAPYASFRHKRATSFKDWLIGGRGKGSKLAESTIRRHLENVRSFFAWLSVKPGYKSKINLSDLAYFAPDYRINTVTSASITKRIPTLEQVHQLISSIETDTDEGNRDRALIAFLVLTGMRDDAVASISIGAIDMDKNRIIQDPAKGVRTKRRKQISSHFFPFDADLMNIFRHWITFLRETKGFSDVHPLFPKTVVRQCGDGFAFENSGVGTEFWSSASPIRQMLKKRAIEAKQEYFNPHSYRHLAVLLAMRCCKTPEQMKAMSQSIGHEQVLTTLTSYGTVPELRVEDVLNEIDFSGQTRGSSENPTDEEVQNALKVLNRLHKKC